MNSVALKKVERLALMESKKDPKRLQALIIISTSNNQEKHLRKQNSSDTSVHNTRLFILNCAYFLFYKLICV